MCDNVPFSSYEFREYAKKWGFVVTTSSPTYPQSNGLSERMVQTMKLLIKKAEMDGRDPYLALLEYRNSPVAGMTFSPAQMLMSMYLPESPFFIDPLDEGSRQVLMSVLTFRIMHHRY